MCMLYCISYSIPFHLYIIVNGGVRLEDWFLLSESPAIIFIGQLNKEEKQGTGNRMGTERE